MDFKLDLLTGDLDITNGLSLVSGGRQRQQQLKLGLSVNLGECFYDTSFGVPYINTNEGNDDVLWLLSDSIPNKDRYIKEVLDEFILSQPWVITLESSYTFNRQQRVYLYSYKVVTEDGDEFTDDINRNL